MGDSLVFGDLALEVDPGTQYLSDAPGLRETAVRTVRRVTIKYLAHRAQTGAIQVLGQRVQKGLREPRIAVHAVVSPCKGCEQAGPDRAHVVGGIAFPSVARAAAHITRFLRAQAAQS